MRWLACAWLLVVGCFDPPTGPPYKIHLLSADPPVVSVHGGDSVTISYNGELPANIGVGIDQMIAPPISISPETHTFTISAPNHETGHAGIGLFDTDRGRAIAYQADLLTYQLMPPLPAWNLSASAQESLSWRLHPELSHPCARGGDLYLANAGDELLTLTGVLSSNDEFTLTAQPSAALEYGEYYTINLCFNSATPGFPASTLTASTNAGDVTVNVTANVTPPLGGLDPTFHGGGLAFNLGQETFSAKGVVGIGGDGILTWAGMRLIAIDSTGTEIHRDIPPTLIGPVSANWILAVRTAPGGGGYALVVNSSQHAYGTILHFDDALVPDAQYDLPFDAENPYFDLQVQTNGRLLAIGDTVVALANGVVDTTYGTNGRTTLITVFVNGYLRSTVLDAQGRLYVAISTGLRRLGADGMNDSSFVSSYTAEMLAIDAADHVYVQSGNRVFQLSETGDPIWLITNGPFGYDVAVDGSGRLYITSGAGIVNRYTNGVASEDLGYGSAMSVICPPSGACYILGVDMLAQVPFSTGPSYMDKYVLRLAD